MVMASIGISGERWHSCEWRMVAKNTCLGSSLPTLGSAFDILIGLGCTWTVDVAEENVRA